MIRSTLANAVPLNYEVRLFALLISLFGSKFRMRWNTTNLVPEYRCSGLPPYLHHVALENSLFSSLNLMSDVWISSQEKLFQNHTDFFFPHLRKEYRFENNFENQLHIVYWWSCDVTTGWPGAIGKTSLQDRASVGNSGGAGPTSPTVQRRRGVRRSHKKKGSHEAAGASGI